MLQFDPFPKIGRFSRSIVITEKIDGTNAQIAIEPLAGYGPTDYEGAVAVVNDHAICAGSRSRWLKPGKATDNFGFAAFVAEHAGELIDLGPGRHFGEWWGAGIQRGYGLKEKRFSLFNVTRWVVERPHPACVGVVPMLYRGEFHSDAVMDAIIKLELKGSRAAPGFMKPEGVIVYHSGSNTLFKKTIEKDSEPKSLAVAA
jgi:RNA ligase